MHSQCINNLLNLKDVIVKRIVLAYHFVKIFIETKPSEQICPHCGNSSKRIHDYRLQKIKDLLFQLKHTILVLKKRKYFCSCGKRIFEKYEFLPTVSRLLDTVNYTVPTLPSCISIDEFKDNAETGKYQCILVGPKKHRILDILPDRTQSHLTTYFKDINRFERHWIKFFISDM